MSWDETPEDHIIELLIEQNKLLENLNEYLKTTLREILRELETVNKNEKRFPYA